MKFRLSKSVFVNVLLGHDKILITTKNQDAKIPFLDLTPGDFGLGLWTVILGLGLGLVNNI